MMQTMTNDDAEASIRAARDAFNDAIARRDADAIAALLLPSYHVITARSRQRDGQDASTSSWRNLFVHDPTATHASTPDRIHVNVGWGMAEEHGHWTGTLTAKTGPMTITGVYAAKWHLTAEGWLLQAEMFTPLDIDGEAAMS